MSEQPSILWRLVAILLVVFLLSPIILLVVFSFTSRGLTNFPDRKPVAALVGGNGDL